MTNVISTPSKLEELQRALHDTPAVLLSCEQSYKKLTMINDMTLAQAFRQAWTCQPLKKRHPPEIAVCHIRGVIKKIYRDLHWEPVVSKFCEQWDDAVCAVAVMLDDAQQESNLRVSHFKTPLTAAEHSRFQEILREMREKLLRRQKLQPTAQDSMVWRFTGNEAYELKHLIGMDLSADLTKRGMANPTRYLNC